MKDFWFVWFDNNKDIIIAHDRHVSEQCEMWHPDELCVCQSADLEEEAGRRRWHRAGPDRQGRICSPGFGGGWKTLCSADRSDTYCLPLSSPRPQTSSWETETEKHVTAALKIFYTLHAELAPEWRRPWAESIWGPISFLIIQLAQLFFTVY